MLTRRTWLLAHRWAGLFMALFLVVAGVTGAVIAFHAEVDRWLNPHLLAVEQRGESLPPAILLEAASQHVSDGIVYSMDLRRGPRESAAFGIAARPGAGAHEPTFNVIYLDPYTGAFLGGRHAGAMKLDREHIVGLLYELHYTLMLPEPWGRWLFGIVAIVWTLDCFVGFYLTLPRTRRAFFRRWRNAWLVRWTASAARMNFDLHRAAALWTWAMLLVLAVSSVQLNLHREVFQPLLGMLLPVRNVRAELASHAPPAGYAPLAWDTALERGRALMRTHALRDGFTVEQETSLSLSAQRGVYAYRVRSTLDIDNRYGRTMIYLSAVDGRELAFEHSRQAAGNLVVRWLAMLHFGHVWGLPFRTFVCVMGIVVALLSVTGVIVWWRKRS